jgi:hypothetical protein
MRHFATALSFALVCATVVLAADQRANHGPNGSGPDNGRNRQLGPRPFFPINDMEDGPLKDSLASCSEEPFKAHRLLDRTSGRSAAVSRAHAPVVRSRGPDGGGNRRM